MYQGRITPPTIYKLKPNQVFVFGSNPEGRHGKGAALQAKMYFGAIYGKGKGIQNQSYAIPTKDLRVKENKGLRSIPLTEIQKSVSEFIEYAKANPDKEFLVVELGTRLAGYTVQEIADLFKDAIQIENIHLPESFWKELEK